MAALDEDDAAQRRRRKQRHEGESLFDDGDVSEHGQEEIFEPLPSRATSASMSWRGDGRGNTSVETTHSTPKIAS